MIGFSTTADMQPAAIDQIVHGFAYRWKAGLGSCLKIAQGGRAVKYLLEYGGMNRHSLAKDVLTNFFYKVYSVYTSLSENIPSSSRVDKLDAFSNLANARLQTLFGDIHNHCDLSYGHGSIEDAFRNARLQLDFASVTVHALWPDLPKDDPRLGYLVDYHERGFARALANWPEYLRQTEAHNVEGEFVTFPSYEWHSSEFGDHCVYFRDNDSAEIIDVPDLASLRSALRDKAVPAFAIPHHIGYRAGYRGINWAAYDPQFSPVAEVFSFHGASESTDAPYPYLHSMGPRDHRSTAQYGWAQGHHFGVVGSTDHHNAFPGAYGYGRMAVLAEARTRAAIWDAIAQRRTYALTGDRILLDFTVNGAVMGSVNPYQRERDVRLSVVAGDALDYVEVLHNNVVVHRKNVLATEYGNGPCRVVLQLGWGELEGAFPWDVSLELVGGRLLDTEPRFRGRGPTDDRGNGPYAYQHFSHEDNSLTWRTTTYRNPSLHTSATEAVSLVLDGTAESVIQCTINGRTYRVPLGDLRDGARTFYTDGFVSPAISFGRTVPLDDTLVDLSYTHEVLATDQSWYTARVRQRNDQWAWSSPIWIGGS
jgi:hypothetical protein